MSDQPWTWEEDARQLEQALAAAHAELDETRQERDEARALLRETSSFLRMAWGFWPRETAEALEQHIARLLAG